MRTSVRILARAMLVSLAIALAPGPAYGEDWNPRSFSEEELLEFYTVNEAGEEHWAKVWFVLLEGEVYVRLGSRAEARIVENANAPIVKVRVAGRTYDRIVAEETPDKVGPVLDLMKDKYWSAMFMGMMPDRFTVRLSAESE